MKKSEIVVGQDYAERRGSYGSMTRVRVVSLDGKVTQGWGYNRKTISGTVVQNVQKDGTLGPERTVPNRQIQELWAPYAEREAAAAKARRDNEAYALSERRRRAALLNDLIPAMRHAGLEDTTTQVWDRRGKFISALEHAGLVGDILVKREESERGEIWGDQYTLTCPVSREIEDFVVTGNAIKFRESDLRIIFGV